MAVGKASKQGPLHTVICSRRAPRCPPITNTPPCLARAPPPRNPPAGVQVSPDLPLNGLTPALQSSIDAAGTPMEWLRGVSSFALAYSPSGGRGRAARTRGGQPMFTAAMEMQEGRNFIVRPPPGGSGLNSGRPEGAGKQQRGSSGVLVF
jgi:hypothetical protein